MKKSTLLLLISLFITVSAWPQHFGSAINLDGLDDYCIVPHHESLNPGDGSWSVALWVKAADKNQVSPFVMKRLTSDPYTQYSYGFAMDDPHNPVAGKRIRVNHIENAGLSERSGHTSGEYIDGNWHHYAIVADPEENGMVIFVNGEPVEFVSLYYFGEWPDVSNVSDLIIAPARPRWFRLWKAQWMSLASGTGHSNRRRCSKSWPTPFRLSITIRPIVVW